MSESLVIIKLGNPLLRQSSYEVNNVKDTYVQKLIDDLMRTLTETNGVGIAAPQVAVNYRLFIVASRANPRYPNAPFMEPIVMINPKIIEHSKETVKGWEGCLSVPGIRGLVARYQSITVEYTGVTGDSKNVKLVDFVARIFQHEYDHLDGIVFLDRVESTKELISEEEYQKIQNSDKL